MVIGKMQWYFSRHGSQEGPVTEEQLRTMIRGGELTPGDLVWNQEMGEQWTPISSLPLLIGSVSLHGVTAPPLGTTPNEELMTRARASLKGKWGLAIMALLIVGVICQLPNLIRFLIDPSAFHPHPPVHHPHVNPTDLWKPMAGILAAIASVFVTGPLRVGINHFSLHLARAENPAIADLFVGFRRGGSYYWRILGATLLIMLIVMGWALASIVPASGLIAGLFWAAKAHPQLHFLTYLIPIPAIAAGIFIMIRAYAYLMTYYIIADDPSVKAREAVRRSVKMMKGRIWKYLCLGFRFVGWALLALLTCGIGFLWLGAYIGISTAHFYDDVKGRADIPDAGV
jgi:uncharacterized membrane protein